jgi:hypothetical protein
MLPEFPTHTVFAIALLMCATGVVAWLVLNQGLVRTLDPSRLRIWQWSIAAVLGVWLLLSLLLAWRPRGGQVQFIPYYLSLVAVGSLLGLGTFVFAPAFRRAILATPAYWLLGAQSIRLFGFVFLALLDMGRLPAQFALPAGYGDMTVGLLALLTSFALAYGRPYARTLAIGVNLLGLLDFITALSTGLSTLAPFGQQLVAAGISPLYLGYVLLVPTFGVPVFALLHVFSLYQLRVQPGATAAGAARAFGGQQHDVATIARR